MADSFHDAMVAGYALSEPALVIGSPMDGVTALPDVRVQVALSILNRHGLVAGATGTGKTKTLQLLAGQLSLAGVPVLDKAPSSPTEFARLFQNDPSMTALSRDGEAIDTGLQTLV